MFKKMNGKMENFATELETKYKQHNWRIIKINKYKGFHDRLDRLED